ncbi:MAG: glycosyltransferase [Planctomycetes bacterium]|nr:glycosyltransferase [Planctomycetota bacterium]
MTQCSRPQILRPEELRTGLRAALGSPARPWGSSTVPRKIGERKLPGYRLDEYEYENGHGERIPLSVAEPDNRLHREPILAMHQTNECGRREVFGLDGEATLAYGHELARRGFRVFSFDMAWTGERSHRQWDKDAFYLEHPHWSMVGKAVAEMHDLAGLIRGRFSETEELRCIGHSLGGLMILFHKALNGDAGLAVCNACYLHTPIDRDPWSAQLYASRVLNPDLRDFCVSQNFDHVVSLAGADSPVALIHYRQDPIHEHPNPTPESLSDMRAYGDGVHVIGVAGSHEFPLPIRGACYKFIAGSGVEPLERAARSGAQANRHVDLLGHEPTPRQRQVHVDGLSLVPDGVRSVLDVGCGDGAMINRFPSGIRVTGVDISPDALYYVSRDRVAASAEHLPFADKQFDLVMANNILEYLDAPSLLAVLREINRVAKRYVLLTCPNNEQLEAGHALCADCGAAYHVHGRCQSFSPGSLLGILAPDLVAEELRYTGDDSHGPHDPCIAVAHQLRNFRLSVTITCPECGSARQESGSMRTPLMRLTAALRRKIWSQDLAESARHAHRSDLMALFGRDRTSDCTESSLPESSADLLEIDFANRLQCTRRFHEGSCWARYLTPPGTWQTETGIRSEWNVSSPLTLEVRFPISPSIGDRIIANVSSHGSRGRLGVYLIDGILAHRRLLANDEVSGLHEQREWTVTQSWWPDRYGAGLAVCLGPDVEIHTLRYVPRQSCNSVAPFIRLEPGHNLIRTRHGEIMYSWGMSVESAGVVPKPLLVEPHESTPTYDPYEMSTPLLQIAAEAHQHFEEDRLNLTEILNRIETARDQAEQAYAAAERRLRRLNDKLDRRNEIAAHRRRQAREFRDRWESAASELQAVRGVRGAMRNVARAVKRKLIGELPDDPKQIMAGAWKPLARVESITDATHRVLVLSHMFPHPEQPSSGPFIHEQVKALRQHGGVDARVVVGRPYWMTHRNPIKAWRANRTYWRYHRRCLQWWEYDSVPVVYLPYRIFGPYFTQGWSYQSSVVAALPWIQQGFDFDIIHAHTAYLDGAAGLGVARKTGHPLIITEHTGPFSMLMRNPLVKRSTLRAMRAAKRVIVVSRAQGRAVSSELGPSESDHVMVVPNVVDTEAFHPPAEWTPDSSSPRIVFVGYFVPIKQLPLLLDAFVLVRETVPGATLRLVGGGESREQEVELNEEIRRRNLNSAVIVQGHQSREKIARILRDECDVLVLCSQSETFGCVLTEAMASGKPIVATRCGGPEDIVLNDRVGRLCENGNPDALAHAILAVVSNIRNYNAQEIRTTAESNFGHSSVVKRLCEVYRGV